MYASSSFDLFTVNAWSMVDSVERHSMVYEVDGRFRSTYIYEKVDLEESWGEGGWGHRSQGGLFDIEPQYTLQGVSGVQWCNTINTT